MADLTLQRLAAAAPDGAITENAGDVVISLTALTGEATVALADAKVGEVISKLLTAAANAQTTYNSGAVEQLNSYPAPTFGTPILDDESGQYYSALIHTVTVEVPLNLDDITGSTI